MSTEHIEFFLFCIENEKTEY